MNYEPYPEDEGDVDHHDSQGPDSEDGGPYPSGWFLVGSMYLIVIALALLGMALL